MLEKNLWSRLHPHLHNWGDATRIENSVEPGTWDIFCAVNGQANWIETKIEKGHFLYFELFQIPWAKRYLKQGLTNMFVISQAQDRELHIYHGSTIVQAPFEKYRKWRRIHTDNISPIHSSYKVDDTLRQLLSTPFTFGTAQDTLDT